jgi:hypothetical protein
MSSLPKSEKKRKESLAHGWRDIFSKSWANIEQWLRDPPAPVICLKTRSSALGNWRVPIYERVGTREILVVQSLNILP